MTKKEALEYIPLLQAYGEGKAIQIKVDEGWQDVMTNALGFHAAPGIYRVKPIPLEAYIWVNDETGEVVPFGIPADTDLPELHESKARRSTRLFREVL